MPDSVRLAKGGEPAAQTEALLYLDGISVSFDGFKALNKLNLAIDVGELLDRSTTPVGDRVAS